jgi:hypothetical protein
MPACICLQMCHAPMKPTVAVRRRRALKLSPSCVPAVLNRGMCYHRMGDARHAEADYTAVLALVSLPVAFRNRGILRVGVGNYGGGSWVSPCRC